MYSYSQWLEDYRARWRSIVTLVDEIPLIDEQAIEDMVSGKDFVFSACFWSPLIVTSIRKLRLLQSKERLNYGL